MTTEDKIFIRIFNAIDPTYLNLYEINNIELFSEELSKAFSKRHILEDSLKNLLNLNSCKELASFIDHYFDWGSTDLSMSNFYDYFLDLGDSPIPDYQNFKIKTIPTLTYDY